MVLEKGIQSKQHQPANHNATPRAPPQAHPSNPNTHRRAVEQESRLAFQEPRPQELCLEQSDLPICHQPFPSHATGGPVRQLAQSQMQTVCIMESGPTLTGQRMGPQLGEVFQLGEPPLGCHTPDITENTTGQGLCPGLCSHVASPTLVEDPQFHPGCQPPRDSGEKHLQRPKGKKSTTTSLGNPFHSGTRLNRMPMTAIHRATRTLEQQHDIPYTTRLSWVDEAMNISTNPRCIVALRQCKRRLKMASKKCKYPVIFPINTLLDLAFKPSQPPLPLSDTLILQIRLTTLIRSGDTASLVWALFQFQNQFFVRCTSKNGSVETFNVPDPVWKNLVCYLFAHRLHPNIFLFRHDKDPTLCLGAERIAKKVLHLMGKAGVDTNIFKAHSLRAATATHLLREGVPKDLIQGRGRWSTQLTLDKYYLALHNQCNWAEVLQGGAVVGRQAGTCAVHSTTSPHPEADEGRRTGGDEECTAQVAALHALSILRPLHDDRRCPACDLTMVAEAVHRCSKCQSVYHVRCMGHYTGVGDTRLRYKTTCFLCSMGERRPAANIIEDPMGICDSP